MHPYSDAILPPADHSGGAMEESPGTESGAVVRLVRDGPVPVASCPHCGGRLQLSTLGSNWQIRRPSDIADRLVVQLGTLEREELHVLVLNTRNVVIDQERVYQGNVSASLVRVGELFRRAVERHDSGIIICHNHPSGETQPSPDDLHLTAEAIRAGQLLDITVLDHLIVGGGAFTSLRDYGVPFGRPHEAHGAGEWRFPGRAIALPAPPDGPTCGAPDHLVRAARPSPTADGTQLSCDSGPDEARRTHALLVALHRIRHLVRQLGGPVSQDKPTRLRAPVEQLPAQGSARTMEGS